MQLWQQTTCLIKKRIFASEQLNKTAQNYSL